MFHVGEYVVYGGSGVCLVTDIGVPACASETQKRYYFLQPLSYQGMIYAPLETPVPMRYAITQQEADRLLKQLSSLPTHAVKSRDRKALEEYYRTLLAPHTCLSMAQTVKSIYQKHAEETSHALTMTEEAILKRTQTMLCQELALALNVSHEAAEDLLIRALQNSKMQEVASHDLS